MSGVKRSQSTDAAIRDICRPWNSRIRLDREVLGAIELAFLRGEHSGYLVGYRDGTAKRRPRRKKFEGL